MRTVWQIITLFAILLLLLLLLLSTIYDYAGYVQRNDNYGLLWIINYTMRIVRMVIPLNILASFLLSLLYINYYYYYHYIPIPTYVSYPCTSTIQAPYQHYRSISLRCCCCNYYSLIIPLVLSSSSSPYSPSSPCCSPVHHISAVAVAVVVAAIFQYMYRRQSGTSFSIIISSISISISSSSSILSSIWRMAVLPQ